MSCSPRRSVTQSVSHSLTRHSSLPQLPSFLPSSRRRGRWPASSSSTLPCHLTLPYLTLPILTAQGELADVVLIDLGLAIPLPAAGGAALRPSRRPIGNPAYRAPELHKQQPYGPAVDVGQPDSNWTAAIAPPCPLRLRAACCCVLLPPLLLIDAAEVLQPSVPAVAPCCGCCGCCCCGCFCGCGCGCHTAAACCSH